APRARRHRHELGQRERQPTRLAPGLAHASFRSGRAGKQRTRALPSTLTPGAHSMTTRTAAQNFTPAGVSAGIVRRMENQSDQIGEGSPAAPVNVGRMERYFSTGLGVALGLAGLAKGRLPGMLLMAGGGGLLY